MVKSQCGSAWRVSVCTGALAAVIVLTNSTALMGEELFEEQIVATDCVETPELLSGRSYCLPEHSATPRPTPTVTPASPSATVPPTPIFTFTAAAPLLVTATRVFPVEIGDTGEDAGSVYIAFECTEFGNPLRISEFMFAFLPDDPELTFFLAAVDAPEILNDICSTLVAGTLQATPTPTATSTPTRIPTRISTLAPTPTSAPSSTPSRTPPPTASPVASPTRGTPVQVIPSPVASVLPTPIARQPAPIGTIPAVPTDPIDSIIAPPTRTTSPSPTSVATATASSTPTAIIGGGGGGGEVCTTLLLEPHPLEIFDPLSQ